MILLLSFIHSNFSVSGNNRTVLVFTFLVSLRQERFLRRSIASFRFAPVHSLAVPALILVGRNGIFASRRNVTLRRIASSDLILFRQGRPFLILLLALLRLLFGFKVRVRISTLLTVRYIRRSFIDGIILSSTVRRFRTLGSKRFLSKIKNRFLRFLVYRIVRRINVSTIQLGNRHLHVLVGSSTVQYRALLPLLVNRVSEQNGRFLVELN